MDKASVCSGFWLWIYTLKKPVDMFEHMEITESIYNDVVEPLYKNPLEKMITFMVTASKWEDNPPCQKLTLIWVNVMSSVSKVM